MKKQSKKSNTQQPKRLQINKTVISGFDTKLVKGGSQRMTMGTCGFTLCAC